ncbi:hypothetical protein KGF56_002398 [Candida oxycetoniae]|uniref:Meiotically up-regulated gene 157 protein n=1 Tax=Candida oxycetoniae TaxID=497107 RepID=A0AAI9WY04_9ASCO|nr:uncharacterized protein KGF56_002398 [Candida oxycetoniae]KAI3404768.2 hypothetical protein KGF56_002398 [Candida oxycetoniae]
MKRGPSRRSDRGKENYLFKDPIRFGPLELSSTKSLFKNPKAISGHEGLLPSCPKNNTMDSIFYRNIKSTVESYFNPRAALALHQVERQTFKFYLQRLHGRAPIMLFLTQKNRLFSPESLDHWNQAVIDMESRVKEINSKLASDKEAVQLASDKEAVQLASDKKAVQLASDKKAVQLASHKKAVEFYKVTRTDLLFLAIKGYNQLTYQNSPTSKSFNNILENARWSAINAVDDKLVKHLWNNIPIRIVNNQNAQEIPHSDETICKTVDATIKAIKKSDLSSNPRDNDDLLKSFNYDLEYTSLYLLNVLDMNMDLADLSACLRQGSSFEAVGARFSLTNKSLRNSLQSVINSTNSNNAATTYEDILELAKVDKNNENKIGKILEELVARGVTTAGFNGDDVDSKFLKLMNLNTKSCPNYVTYSQSRHPPFSSGPRKFPYMRPAPKCRTFVSSAVENIITDLKMKIEDADLARLMENCLPNTLDTTILWHTTEPMGQSNNNNNNNPDSDKDTLPQTFVVTGDIHAEWLRDAARQLSVYQPFIKYDASLRQLILGAINTQAFYVNNSPYCNAFHPPPGSNVKRGMTAFDNVLPRPDWRQVFECKYEIDSLASFLTLTNEYYENSDGDTSFINEQWLQAYEKLLIVLERESNPTFDEETGRALPFYYSFQRNTNIGSETLSLGGAGNPVNYGTGLIRSAFRPSDDATIFQFFIPGNMHMLAELERTLANILEEKESFKERTGAVLQNMKQKTIHFIEAIKKGIENFGIVNHPIYGKVYAYEVDGYASATFMDDANIPSLLSIPELGYKPVDDEVYQNTRKMIFEKRANPYYLKGKYFEGIGGPHIGIRSAWPMSLLVKIRTTDDDEEILASLKMVMDNTANLGLMHESVDVDSMDGTDYTRPWFAWCNSEFGKTILHLAQKKPHLIFKEEWKHTPFSIKDALSKESL